MAGGATMIGQVIVVTAFLSVSAHQITPVEA
jgi:hypothetical protein